MKDLDETDFSISISKAHSNNPSIDSSLIDLDMGKTTRSYTAITARERSIANVSMFTGNDNSDELI